MTTMEAPTRGLYDKSAAAGFLSTSERRVDRLRREGKLRAVRDGASFKFTEAELLRYIQALSA